MDQNVENFTVSYSFDTNGGYGRKSSNFLSVTFRLPSPTSIEDFEITRLEASRKVTLWAIQDAVMRGELSSSDAKERIEVLRINYEGMLNAIKKKSGENDK